MANLTTQSQLVRSLLRIEPTQGLYEYVLETKPYHTKILDVLVEYVYAEELNVTFTERLSWIIELRRPDVDTVYSCGYGIIWDPLFTLATPDSALVPIVIQNAQDAVAVPAPASANSNSFLIQSTARPPFVVAVASVGNNQLFFAENYNVVGTDIVNNEWDVSDALNELATELTPGATFYISSDTGLAGNGKYTVVSVTWALGVAAVKVVEIIPVQASGDGVLHRPLIISELPQWPGGQAVTFTAVGTLPTPLVIATRYYFQPTATAGFFNLSTVRFPNQFSHFVDLMTLGTGLFSVLRDETLVPGANINVTNTYLHRNDGSYTVKDIQPAGVGLERVFVYQKIPAATPTIPPLIVDGIINFTAQGYDEPIYCPPSQMSDLHMDTFIHESLKFDFQISFSDQLGVTAEENKRRGYGETAYGDSLFGPYGSFAFDFFTRTAVTSGNHWPVPPNTDHAHMVLPTGIDTQMFDVGGFDEDYGTVREYYGRSIPG